MELDHDKVFHKQDRFIETPKTGVSSEAATQSADP